MDDIKKSLIGFAVERLDTCWENIKLCWNLYFVKRREHFMRYMQNVEKQCSYINTFADKNAPRLLNELYVPLGLIYNFGKKKNHSIRINEYPTELIEEHKKILITDDAGMGKSTFLKWLFIQIFANGNYGIPIYIELRKLNKDVTLLDFICDQLSTLTQSFNKKLLSELISQGGFVFLFDGYDEISLVNKNIVTTNIQEFISKAGDDNAFILTSRPDDSLSGFIGFYEFKMQPLDKEAAYSLLRKYDYEGSISKKLIQELKYKNHKGIDTFLGNPLLLSLLYTAYNYEMIIPLKKSDFYRQVFKAYCHTHDLSKDGQFIHDKHSGLSDDDFELVLRSLGYNSFIRNEIEFSRESIIKLIDEIKKDFPSLKFNTSDYLLDISSTIPFFIEENSRYRWVHSSLQEYFAALFLFQIPNSQKNEILGKLYDDKYLKNYINLLDFYYDIDPDGFEHNILFPLYDSYMKFYEQNRFVSYTISAKHIEKRIGILFQREVSILKIQKSTIDALEYEDIVTNTIQPNFKEELPLITPIDGYQVWILTLMHAKNQILSLVHERKPNLFVEPKLSKKIDNSTLSVNQITSIGIHTKEDNSTEFLYFNNLISIPAHYYIEYDVCKREYERLNNQIRIEKANQVLRVS